MQPKPIIQYVFLGTVANLLAQLSLRDFKETISIMKEGKETQARKDY